MVRAAKRQGVRITREKVPSQAACDTDETNTKTAPPFVQSCKSDVVSTKRMCIIENATARTTTGSASGEVEGSKAETLHRYTNHTDSAH